MRDQALGKSPYDFIGKSVESIEIDHIIAAMVATTRHAWSSAAAVQFGTRRRLMRPQSGVVPEPGDCAIVESTTHSAGSDAGLRGISDYSE
jgi:hypothetical protein